MNEHYDQYEIERPETEIPCDSLAKINAEITEGILAQGLPLADDHERESHDQAKLFETLDSFLIYVSSKEQITKTIEDDSPKKSATVELYVQEIIQKVFALIAGYVQIKKMRSRKEFDKKDITSALQFCWQKIVSKESRLYILEKMRQLIQKEDDEDIKKKLLESFVKSIGDPENHPFGILLEDRKYAEIHQELAKLSSAPSDHKSLTTSMMLDMIEANLLTDNDLWDEISLHSDFKNFLGKVCSRYEDQFKDIDPIVTQAWENILYPRLLVWGNLIYSDSLLLPKNQTEN